MWLRVIMSPVSICHVWMSQAVAVDVKTRTVTFQDGLKMEYRKLFVATGSR